jgi:hypothetical protein
MIGMLMMERAQYSPGAMLTFWQRVEQDEELRKRAKALRRDLSPEERTKIIEALLPQTPPATAPPPDADTIQTSHRDFNAVERTIQ